MKRSLGIILFAVAVLSNGCAYYSNRIEVGFKNLGYTNCGQHKPVNLWWKATVIDSHNLGLIYYGEKHYGRDSVLTIGFIQMPETMDRVELDSITLLPPDKTSAPVALIAEPEHITFVEKEFPLFDSQSPDGKSVLRDYAELGVSVDLPPKRKPYAFKMSGRYIARSGKIAVFSVDEVISVRRERKIQSIANAW